MEKGKFYTVLGIEGIELNRKSGLKVHYKDASAVDEDGVLIDVGDGALVDVSGIDEEVVDEITDDIQDFIESGLDILVGGRWKKGTFMADEVVNAGVEDCEWDVESYEEFDDEDDE